MLALLLFSNVALIAAPVATAISMQTSETWDSPTALTTWTVEGQLASIDPTVARSGSSLRMAPNVAGPLSVSKPLSGFIVGTAPWYITTHYRAANINTDVVYELNLTTDVGYFGVNFAGGPGHNQIILFSGNSTDHSVGSPLATVSAGGWYNVNLTLDAVAMTLNATVRDNSGAQVGGGGGIQPPVAVQHITETTGESGGGGEGPGAPEGSPSEVSSITGVRFTARADPSMSPLATPAMNFDDLKFLVATPPAPPVASAIGGPAVGEVKVSWTAPLDNGGAPITKFRIYAGPTATALQPVAVVNADARSYVISGLANGEWRYFRVSAINNAGESVQSNQVGAQAFTLPSAPRSLSASQGPAVGQIRLTWQTPSDIGGPGASLTSYRIYRGESTGASQLLAMLAPNVLTYTDPYRTNGTTYYYNVTATNVVGEGPTSLEVNQKPKPDAASAPAALQVYPDTGWSGQSRRTSFTYTVTASECEPTISCPVQNEWRIYLDGSATGADGTLLASGTNTHEGHAQTTTYTVALNTTPVAPDGVHRVKVLVNPRMGSTQWSLAGTNIQVGLPQPSAACLGTPGYYTYMAQGVGWLNTTARNYTEDFAYKLNGVTSTFRAKFQDGCKTAPSGDGAFELGYGGVLLSSTAAPIGTTLQAIDALGYPVSFILGSDVDNNGVIGDGALDCIAGPFTYQGAIPLGCTPDANAKYVMIVLPSELGSSTVWGRVNLCSTSTSATLDPCHDVRYPSIRNGHVTAPFEANDILDPYGDGWTDVMNQRANGAAAVHTTPSSDQEFASPCTDCSGAAIIGDGASNAREFQWQTIPIGPVTICEAGQPCRVSLANARDADNDNWLDGSEIAYWNDPANDDLLNSPHWGDFGVLPLDEDKDAWLVTQGPATVHLADVDADGLMDGDEYNLWRSYPELADSDCLATATGCPAPSTPPTLPRSGTPGTGDGVRDAAESAYWASIGQTAAFDDQDADGIASNLLDPDADGDGLLDGAEIPVAQEGACIIRCTSAGDADTDGDLLLDGATLVLTADDPRSAILLDASILHDNAEGGYKFYGELTLGTDPSVADADFLGTILGSPPSQPRNLVAAAAEVGATIQLSWDPPADRGGLSISHYRVFAGPTPNELVSIGTPIGTTLEHAGLLGSRTYHYAVRAVNPAGESTPSNGANATTQPIPPHAPVVDVDLGPFDYELTVGWEPPAHDGGRNITSYKVYAGGTPLTLALVNETNTSEFVHRGLAPGQTQFYEVRAVNAMGEGAPSTHVSAQATECWHTWGNELYGQTVDIEDPDGEIYVDNREPNHLLDKDVFMQCDPKPRAGDRVYFDAIMLQTGVGDVSSGVSTIMGANYQLFAIYGLWKDCNQDGYIGTLLGGGTLEYRAELLLDDSLCPPIHGADPYRPPEGAHNYNGWVREMFWLVPPRQDGLYSPSEIPITGSRVWADYGGPNDPYDPFQSMIFPVPYGTFDDFGTTFRFVDYITGGTLTTALETPCQLRALRHATNGTDTTQVGVDANATSHELTDGAPCLTEPDILPGSPEPYQQAVRHLLTVYEQEMNPHQDDSFSEYQSLGLVPLPLDQACDRYPSPDAIVDDNQNDPRDPGALWASTGIFWPYFRDDLAAVNRTARECADWIATEIFGAFCPAGTCIDLARPNEIDNMTGVPLEARSRYKTQPDLILEYRSAGRGEITGGPWPAAGLYVNPVGAVIDPSRPLNSNYCMQGLCNGWYSRNFFLAAPHVDNGLQGEYLTPSIAPTGTAKITAYAGASDPVYGGGGFSEMTARRWKTSNYPTQGIYGAAQCGDSEGIENGWDCDPYAWACDSTLGTCLGRRPLDPRVKSLYWARDIDVLTYASLPGIVELDQNQDGVGDNWIEQYARHLIDVLDQLPDLDGANAVEEFRWKTNPLVPDTDADGWVDGNENYYWNATPDSQFFAIALAAGVAVNDSDATYNSDNDTVPGPTNQLSLPLYNQHDPDSDNDGLLDGAEFIGYQSFPEYPDSDCIEKNPDASSAHIRCPWPGSEFAVHYDPSNSSGMGAGDNFSDKAEATYWENYDVPGALIGDHDEDGIKNNLLDADADGDELLDGDEVHPTEPFTATDPLSWDSDEDGLLDGNDLVLLESDHRVLMFRNTAMCYVEVEGTFTFYGERMHPADDVSTLGCTQDVSYGGGLARFQGIDPTNGNNELPQHIIDFVNQMGGGQTVEFAEAALEYMEDPCLDDFETEFWAGLIGEEECDELTPVNMVRNLSQALAETWIVPLENASEEIVSCVEEHVPLPDLGFDPENPDVPTVNYTPALPSDELLPCALGVVEGFVDRTLTPLESAPYPLPEALDLTPLNVLEEAVVSRLPFTPPVLPELDLKEILRGNISFGPPDPVENSLSNVTGQLPPLPPLHYEATPFPRMTAQLTEALGQSTVFERLAEHDRNLAGIELIGTLDSGLYNIWAHDPSTNRTIIADLNPVGAPRYVDLDNGSNHLPAGAELLVTTALAGESSTQRVVLTVEKLVPTPLKVNLASFLQVPDTNIIVGLGVDGTEEALSDPRGLPENLEVSIGTNALWQSAPNMTPNTSSNLSVGASSYEFNVATSDRFPTHPSAAVFRVDNTQASKPILPHGRTNISFAFPATPDSATAALTMPPSGAGFNLVWSASQESDFTLYIASRDNELEATLEAQGFPTSASTDFAHQTLTVPGDEREYADYALHHTASAVIDVLNVTWYNATTAHGGGLAISRVPRAAEFAFSEHGANLSYESRPDPVGEIQPLGQLQGIIVAGARPEDAPCHGAPHGAYVVLTKQPDLDCITLNLSEVITATAAWPALGDLLDVSVHAERALPSEDPLVFELRSDDYFFVNASNWPTEIDISVLREPTRVNATWASSDEIDRVVISRYDDETSLDARIEALPTYAAVDALYPTGRLDIHAATSSPLRDVRVSVVPSDPADADWVSLGSNDGLILSGQGGSLDSVSLRVRNFTKADLTASVQTGLDLATDTASNNPFVLRWTGDDQWISADLHRLPRNVTATYNRTTTGFDFHYTATDPIPTLGGEFRADDGIAVFKLNLSELPTKVDLAVNITNVSTTSELGAAVENINVTTAMITTSSTIGHAEFSLTGNDGLAADLSEYDNYVDVNLRDRLTLGSLAMPRVAFRISQFDSAFANMSERALNATATFSTNPGTFAARYLAEDAWFNVNVTSDLPSHMNFSLNDGKVMWNASNESVTNLHGAASSDAFKGNWTLAGIPDSFNITFAKQDDDTTGVVLHSGDTVDLIDLSAVLDLPGLGEPAFIHAHVEDLPSALHVKALGGVGTIEVNLTDSDGARAQAGVIQVAFAASGNDQVVRHAEREGAIVYSRGDGLGLHDLFVRLPGLSYALLETTPNASRDMRRSLVYHALGDVNMSIDMEQGGLTLRGTIRSLPADFDAQFFEGENATDFIVNSTTSAVIRDLDMELDTGSYYLKLDVKDYPTSLGISADRNKGRFELVGSSPADFVIAGAAHGHPLLKGPSDSDHVLVALSDLSAGGQRMAINARGLQLALLDLNESYARFEHDAARPLNVNFTNADLSIHADVEDLPAWLELHGKVSYDPNDPTAVLTRDFNISYKAAGPVENASFAFRNSLMRVWGDIEGIPPEWVAAGNLSDGHVKVYAETGSHFRDGRIRVSRANATDAPVLSSNGLVVDLAPNGTGIPIMQLAARLDGIKSLEMRDEGDQIRLKVDRDYAGTRTGEDGFRAQIKTEDGGAYLNSTAFPRSFEVLLGTNSTTGAMQVDATAPNGTFGDVRAEYKGGILEFLNLTATNITDRVAAQYGSNATRQLFATYEGSNDTNVTTNVSGRVSLEAGYQANLSFDRVPSAFSIEIDAENKTGHFTATRGALTGSASLRKPGVPYQVAPKNYDGISFGQTPDEFYAWLRVTNLTSAKVTTNLDEPGRYDVEVNHSTRPSRPFKLRFENATIDMSLVAVDLPKAVNATVRWTNTTKSVHYGADAPATAIDVTLNLSADASDSAAGVDKYLALLRNGIRLAIPTSMYGVVTQSGSALHGEFGRAETGTRAPFISVRGTRTNASANETFLFGNLSDLPERTEVWFDPEAATLDPEGRQCTFRATSTSTIGLLGLKWGFGVAREAGWAAESKSPRRSWLAIDRTNESPIMDARLWGLEGGSLCTHPKWNGTVTLADDRTSVLRVAYTDPAMFIRAQLDSLDGGNYTLVYEGTDTPATDDDRFEYFGQHITALHVEGDPPGTLFDRNLTSVVIDAWDVPSRLTVGVSKTSLTLGSGGEEYGDLRADILLAQINATEPSTAEDPTTAELPEFTFDAAELRARSLEFGLAVQGEATTILDATNWVVLDFQAEPEISAVFEEFDGADIRLHPTEGITMSSLRMRPLSDFDFRYRNVDTQLIPYATMWVPQMPDNLQFNFDASADGLGAVLAATGITPEGRDLEYLEADIGINPTAFGIEGFTIDTRLDTDIKVTHVEDGSTLTGSDTFTKGALHAVHSVSGGGFVEELEMRMKGGYSGGNIRAGPFSQLEVFGDADGDPALNGSAYVMLRAAPETHVTITVDVDTEHIHFDGFALAKEIGSGAASAPEKWLIAHAQAASATAEQFKGWAASSTSTPIFKRARNAMTFIAPPEIWI